MSRLLPIASPSPADSFDGALDRHGLGPLRRAATTTLQINVGKVCNQACHHCHVDAGPKRTESMSAETAARILDLLAESPGIAEVDITGGAPELNPSFRLLVETARRRGLEVIDRCNLTVLLEPGMEGTADFLAAHRVRITASLPCYSRANVDAQRGKGVFGRSIEGLRLLNRLGYGDGASGLILDLVYNPGGAFLPPPQDTLEADYRASLRQDFGIEFDNLLTITNLPISRFDRWLRRQGKRDEYMELLEASFNPDTIAALMCRSLVSVGWDGALYDCDFNQMLEMPLPERGRRPTIRDIDSFDLAGDLIATGPHCFGCTAGAGSSCGGSLAR
jgi:radical SAM/Cys-rich protein